jgi:Tfp pilus assembly protein FimT
MDMRITNVKKASQSGFGLVEAIIVLIVIAILVVLALPQLMSSRRLIKFNAVQSQISTMLREARQDAVSQRTAITFRYEDANKRLILYGGSYGTMGDTRNRVVSISGDGVDSTEIVYGRPAGASAAALGDTTNLTALTSGAVEVRFQPDGSVVDAASNPQNRALFFYNSVNAQGTAFAVSVLGAGGRVKLWKYNSSINAYVE